MFSEESIYGTHVTRRDEKNRIFLPSFTGASKDDSLIIIKYKEFYKILRKDLFEKALDEIENEIAKLIRVDKKVVTVMDLYANGGKSEELRMLESYRDSLCYTVVREAKVDGQRRIAIGNLYENDKELYIVGAKDSVHLMNAETYNQINNKLIGAEGPVKAVTLG